MIYYVEDDDNIRDLALYALKTAGLEAEGFSCAEAFFQAVHHRVPDLVLLDIMLPGTSGLEILAALRKDPHTAHVPAMMLTAKGTEYDKVIGLDSGADDYLPKPFGMMELVSRCKALLRRASRIEIPAQAPVDTLTCGPLTINLQDREAYADQNLLPLTLKEFDLLYKLVKGNGRAYTRAQLLEEIWGITYVGETRTVDTHIQTLRRKLNDALPGAGDIIRTVRGVGYRAKFEEHS